MSRLDCVKNDKDEERDIMPLWKKRVFVLCFTDCESNTDYFWREYTQNSKAGLRLKIDNPIFTFEKMQLDV